MELLLLLILLGFSAALSGSETAFFSLAQADIASLVQNRGRAGRRLADILGRATDLPSALLIGNLLAIASILPLKEGIDISVVAQGMEMMGAGSMLYPALTLHDLVLANSVVIVLGLLTSLLPAWRASQYKPVEAIAKT